LKAGRPREAGKEAEDERKAKDEGRKKALDRLKVVMVLDVPRGAYYHYCAELCNALVKHPQIAEVRLAAMFAERHRPGISAEEKALLDPRVAIDVIGPGGRSKGWRYFAFFKNLARHLREISRSPSCVVHLQTGTGLQLLDTALPLLYRFLGLAVVRTLHEPTAAERIKVPTRFEEWVGRQQLKSADALIVHDVPTQRRLLDRLDKKSRSVVVIPHGHYLMFRKYIPVEKKEEMPDHHPPVALFLGVKRHKGLEVFIQALRQLQERGFPIEGKIVGQINPGDEDLVDSIKGLKNARIDPGYLPNDTLWKSYAESDFVVLPYLKGTTSGAIHLAYAFKRPVIASDLDCFKELVTDGKTGFVVPRGDASALAEAMVRICRDRRERIAMGEAGFQRISSEGYSWERIAEVTAELYAQTLKRKKGEAAGPYYKGVLEGKE
jgi:glycosyltransferase involved in cell wall biosynthesis